LPNETGYTPASVTVPYAVALNDYAGCNGNWSPFYGSSIPSGVSLGAGIFLSQATGRNTVQTSDIVDGLATTLMLGEKACNPRLGPIAGEDDIGFFSGFGSTTSFNGGNFNTIRFTATNLLPLRDSDVKGPTGGAFGSAHPGTFNALMADGSVVSLSYTISSSVYSALGTIRGREVINESDLLP
jgi:prepilin-type processing-associated H-X9-DG protein